MKFAEAIVDKQASFAYFVYPFLFNTKEFAAHTQALENAQLSVKEKQFKVWDEQKFRQDDLIAQVSNYLNSTDHVRLWKINNALRDAFGFRADWDLLSPQGKIPFCFGEPGEGSTAVQLALFKTGVGFITILAHPKSSNVNNWLNFLHYFRLIQGQQDVKLQSQKRTGIDPQTQETLFSPFFPEYVGGITEHPDARGELAEILQVLLATGAIDSNSKKWWQDVSVPGQLLPFTALFVDLIPTEQIPYLVYKLSNFLEIDLGNNPPLGNWEQNNPHLLPYAEKQWFMFTLDGGAFLAADAPETDFFREILPDRHREEYFLLFLLTLHQRFTLMSLLTAIAQNWLIDSESNRETQREANFAELRDRLFLFTAQGYFDQVMQRSLDHRCYGKWQEIFQLEQLYQKVSDQVREMQNYFLHQRSERLTTENQTLQLQSIRQVEITIRQVRERFTLFASLLGIPLLLFTFLGINIQGFTVANGIAWWLAILIAFTGLGCGVLVFKQLHKQN